MAEWSYKRMLYRTNTKNPIPYIQNLLFLLNMVFLVSEYISPTLSLCKFNYLIYFISKICIIHFL